MANPVITFENDARNLKLVFDLAENWKPNKKGGYYFQTQRRIDFRGDRWMNVQLEILPQKSGRSVQKIIGDGFPVNSKVEIGNHELITYEILNRKLSIIADLRLKLMEAEGNPTVLPNSGRNGFHSKFTVKVDNADFYLSLLVYLGGWPPKPKVTWEDDLLPFFSGGLPGLGKRR